MEYSENGRRSMWLRILLAVLSALLVILAVIAVWLGWSYYGGGTASKKSVLTVTFDCNAEESELDYQPEDQCVAYGEKASCPAYPTRTDYAFNGWYTDAACTSAYDFSAAVTADLTLYADWVDLDSEEAQITDEECETFFNCLEALSEIYYLYADSTGYVPEGSVADAVTAAAHQAEEHLAAGVITYYNASDENVYMEFTSGLTYLFCVPEEGTDADPTELDGATALPFYGVTWAYENSASVDAEEDGIVQLVQEISSGSVYYGSSLTWTNGFDYLEGCELLVWHGHGEYSSDLGPILLTSETVSTWLKLADELDLYVGADYQILNRLFCTKMITLSGVGDTYSYALTPSYIQWYFPELDDAFVYIAACHSGQDSRLADAFLDIGAEVVIANAGTDSIHTSYNIDTVKNILSMMSGEYSDYPGYYSVQDALDLLVSLGLGTDPAANTYPKIFYASGNADAVNYTLWAGLTGTIVSEDDIDMSQVKVILYNTSTNSRVGTVTPDSDGSFTFDQLDGGDSYAYSLHVTYEGTSVYTQPGINITAHRYLDLGKIAIEKEEEYELTVYVTDTSGNALSGASVYVAGTFLGMTGSDGAVSGSFADGTYAVTVTAPSGYQSGSGSAEVDGDDVSITIQLVSGMEIEIMDYLTNYKDLVSLLGMTAYEGSAYYGVGFQTNDFTLEYHPTIDMFYVKNSGNTSITLYGFRVGDSASELASYLEQTGWIKANSNYYYLKNINNRGYMIVFDTNLSWWSLTSDDPTTA